MQMGRSFTARRLPKTLPTEPCRYAAAGAEALSIPYIERVGAPVPSTAWGFGPCRSTALVFYIFVAWEKGTATKAFLEIFLVVASCGRYRGLTTLFDFFNDTAKIVDHLHSWLRACMHAEPTFVDTPRMTSLRTVMLCCLSSSKVLGGYGYCDEYQVERLWRDAKLLEIGGGTLEAHHKNMVSSQSGGVWLWKAVEHTRCFLPTDMVMQRLSPAYIHCT